MTCEKMHDWRMPGMQSRGTRIRLDAIVFGVKRDTSTRKQCNGTKRVWVAGVGPHANPVKVVCGECAED